MYGEEFMMFPSSHRELMYRGWLTTDKDTLEELKKTCSLKVLSVDFSLPSCYQVEITREGFEILDDYWGSAIWGLELK